MLRATLKSLIARKLRLLLSGFAVVLGVAFVVGSYVFTDTIEKTFDEIFGGLSADVVVRPRSLLDSDFFTMGVTGGTSATVPHDLVERIEQVPGVERADGEVENQGVFVLDTNGHVISTMGAPGVAVNWHDGPAADGSQVLSLVDGRLPDGPGEIALDTHTFENSGYAVGDEVSLVTMSDEPELTAELVGVVQFGESGSLAGASLTVFETRTAQDLFLDGADAYSQISVTTDGTGAGAVAEQIDEILPSGVEAVTGAEVDAETATALEEGFGFFTTFLLVFAGIALFVGVFLILNTFSILVAQRGQELALLRALGASRAQVLRSVLTEAAVVGLVGSTFGVLLGVGVAWLLVLLFRSFGLDLAPGLAVLPRTIVVAYVVGVVVTMVAAVIPARRAAKVPPVAAMRAEALSSDGSRVAHSWLGAVLLGLGAVAMVLGLVTDLGYATWMVGGGILAVFVGVALLAPVITVPLVRLIAGWYSRVFGVVGRLARENAVRNPRRTAATSSALMIGLALVSALSIVGASANASVDKALDSGLKADFVIANAVGMPFSPTVAASAREVDGVREVVPVRIGAAQVDERQVFVQAFDPVAFGEAATLELTEGRADLPPRGALLGADEAESRGLSVGDTVRMTLPAAEFTLTVTGIYAEHPLLSGGFVLSLDALADGGVAPVDALVYVVTDDGADTSAVYEGLREATAGLPMVTVSDRAAYAEQSRDQVNQLLYLVYALVGLAVLIAVLGIVNTLALSVLERTREIGLLRAVGLSRRQLRSAIRLESVAIAVMGAVMGIVLGVVFGLALQRAIAEEGLDTLAVPVVGLVVFLVLSALAGVLAAVWPARRAARLDVLRAVTAE